MDNNFESKLPNDYVAVKHVNAKSDKKTVFIYTLLSLVPPVIILPVLIFAAKHFSGYEISENLFSYNGTAALIITCAVLLIYIVLHEVLHGITYKIFTGNKLVFGLTLTVVFCGVPDIYVRKKASLYSLLMPFVVFSIFFRYLRFCCGLYRRYTA